MGQAQEVEDQADINNVEDCADRPEGLGLVGTVPLNKEEVRHSKRSTYIRGLLLELDAQELLANVFDAPKCSEHLQLPSINWEGTSQAVETSAALRLNSTQAI